MSRQKLKERFARVFSAPGHLIWALPVLITMIFSVLLYPSLLVSPPNYEMGDVAERNIKATRDFFIEDQKATEINRRQAVEAVVTVYDYDAALGDKIAERVRHAFGMMHQIMSTASESRQAAPPDAAAPDSPSASPKEPPSPHQLIAKLKPRFEEMLGVAVSNGAYTILEKEGFSNEIAGNIGAIVKKVLDNGVVANKEFLLREADKGIMLRKVDSKSEVHIRSLKRFYGLDQSKAMVRIEGEPLLKDTSYTVLNLVVDFAQKLIQPNITLNRNETEERKALARESVKPVMYKIKAGEMLLREGERVSETQLLKLKDFQNHIQAEQVISRSLGAALILFCLMGILYVICLTPRKQITSGLNRYLLFIASVFVIFLLLTKLSASYAETLASNSPISVSASAVAYGMPLAAGAMTVCLFMGLEIAAPFALVLSAAAAILFGSRLELFLFFLPSTLMAAYWMQSCRERKVFIRAGVKLGLLNMLLVLAVDMYTAEFAGFKLAWDLAFALTGGILSGIITAGMAPFFEIVFNFTTDIKLLELANLDQPILRRLMLEAPGTYHHSVIVGSMVEAAAADIGANPLLAKVCGYYHDIGKLKKPLYFIENQMPGKNKHDKLAPSMSSLILIAHLKNGVELARENKLGEVIIDTIRQHHGTSLIRYFYEKARQIKGEESVNIDHFRYPGPKPQTKEAGLVMLADVVEAASRTLENPTPSRIQGLVLNLINQVFSDGQLDDCELTLKDLHSIARSFNKILNGIHHHRIEYAEKSASANAKVKNGSSDRQSAKQVSDRSGEAREKSPGHLKRLGVS